MVSPLSGERLIRMVLRGTISVKDTADQLSILRRLHIPTQKIIPPVICGSHISYYPTFLNTLTCEREKPPDALRIAYKRLIKKLQADAEYVALTKRRYLITKGTRAFLKKGSVLGPPFNSGKLGELI